MSKQGSFALALGLVTIALGVFQTMYPIIPPYIGYPIVAIAGIGAILLTIYGLREREHLKSIYQIYDTDMRKPSGSEVADVIRLLEAETLTFRSNDEEERSYSFAQVFLAIAHQLSIGISSIYFEEKVRKELAIDANEGWYLPHEDEGITHLIALLHQNTLINRSDEEHQHMVPDYSQGLTTLANPKLLPEKRIEAKYSLSPFGVKVLQQLRKQPISHKEGSQSLGDGIQPIVIDKAKLNARLRHDVGLLIIEGKEVLKGFKSVRTHDDVMPTDEFQNWRGKVTKTLQSPKLVDYYPLWFSDVGIDIKDSLLRDFIEACEAGLERLEEILKALRE